MPLPCCMSSDKPRKRKLPMEIDNPSTKVKMYCRRRVKILLLGAGESGKSTFLKQMRIQMRITHGRGYSKEDLVEFKPIIYSNVLKGMKVLADARRKLKIPWGDPNNQVFGDSILSFQSSVIDTQTFLGYLECVEHLWEDVGIQDAYRRRNEFHLGDSTKYFLDNLARIGKEEFQPTEQDALHSFKATEDIQEYNFEIEPFSFVMVDVGGQTSQRAKWFQCFDEVTSILFMVSSNAFDQVIMEDGRTNCLMESRSIFEMIVNNERFANIPIILFLNKTDLLTDKIRYSNISDYFPEFQGRPDDLSDVQSFILQLFDSRRRERSRDLFHHFTTAIDTENITSVFRAVKETILNGNLEALMLQ